MQISAGNLQAARGLFQILYTVHEKRINHLLIAKSSLIKNNLIVLQNIYYKIYFQNNEKITNCSILQLL